MKLALVASLAVMIAGAQAFAVSESSVKCLVTNAAGISMIDGTLKIGNASFEMNADSSMDADLSFLTPGRDLLFEGNGTKQLVRPTSSNVQTVEDTGLKDPNATVKYHTGIDMKSVQDIAPRSEPHGTLSNRPVQVDDDLESIVKALGGDANMLKGINLAGPKTSLPTVEY